MNVLVNTLTGFGRTLKQIPVIIGLAAALLLGGFTAVLAGTGAGAVGFLAAGLILRGLAPVMKKVIKPGISEGKRQLIGTLLAIPLMIVLMLVPAFALKFVAVHLVPSLITSGSYSWALLLGIFISLNSVKHA